MKAIVQKIENSFKNANKGNEEIPTLIWRWGAISYIISYFIIDKFIKINNISFIDNIIAISISSYFIWHIFALKKCTPKKPKLNKKEKAAIRAEKRRNFGKKFLRKLFLQEPLTKMDPIFITIILDVFCISHFLGYINL